MTDHADRNAEIERAYRNGDTAPEIAARHGLTYQRIYMILRLRGVTSSARPTLKAQLNTIKAQLDTLRGLRTHDHERHARQMDIIRWDRDAWKAEAERYASARLERIVDSATVLEFRFRVDQHMMARALDKASMIEIVLGNARVALRKALSL